MPRAAIARTAARKRTKDVRRHDLHRSNASMSKQTNLFKNYDRWRPQQKIMWAEIRKKTGRGKNRCTIREMFADERCTGAVLDFLRTTKVGARTGPRERPPDPGGEREEGDTRSS